MSQIVYNQIKNTGWLRTNATPDIHYINLSMHLIKLLLHITGSIRGSLGSIGFD